MVCAKLLMIVTDPEARRQLLATWQEFVIRQPGAPRGTGPSAVPSEGPVAFTRLNVREGLALAVFVVEGAWRREYVCRVLAEQVDGYALLLGDGPADLSLGKGLWSVLARRLPGIVAATVPKSEELIRKALELPEDMPIPIVDCGSRGSISEVICRVLEYAAAVPAR